MQSLLRFFIAARSLRFAAFALLLLFADPSRAAINTLSLGAHYDATQANINFRVSSLRATRIEVWIYKTPSAAQEVTKYVLTKDTTTNVWFKAVSVATLQGTYGITGTVYYGYRAW